MDGNLFDWLGDRQNYTPAVQKSMTVCTSRFMGLVLHRTMKSTEPLQVYFHANCHCYDLRKRGSDRHLFEPDRGLCPIGHPNLRQVTF